MPTQIESEIERLQEVVDVLADTLVPALETLRATAKAEIDKGGITSETYNAVSTKMAEVEKQTLISFRQADHIHILMNQQVEDPAPPEGHKCWPPGSNCH